MQSLPKINYPQNCETALWPSIFILRRKYILNNWINLDNLPRRNDGKINWKKCNHNLVEFYFDGVKGTFIIKERTDRHHVIIEYEGNEYRVNTDSLLKLHLESFVRLSKMYIERKVVLPSEVCVDNNFVFNIDDKIDSCYGRLRIISPVHFIRSKLKGYKCKQENSGIIIYVTEYELVNNIIINRFNKRGIIIGVNDLWQTKPDVAKMLIHPEEGHLYTKSSTKIVSVMCPMCGHIINDIRIGKLSSFSFSCPFCGDGISFPNKLMANVLRQLNVNFKTEIIFPWCTFPDYKDNNQISYGRYDFVLPDMKLIIEMDGGLGHGKDPHGKSCYTKDELIYRDKCKDSLAVKNGYSIIRVDCDYSSFNQYDYCKNNIIQSLSQYLSFDTIDWNDAFRNSSKSILIDIVDLYNSGLTARNIATELNLDYTSVLDYLYKADHIGLCKYYKNMHINNSRNNFLLK